MTVIPSRPTRLDARTTADFIETIERYSDAAGVAPLDLTGWSFAFRVKRSVHDAEAVLEATLSDGVEIADAAAGRLVVRFDKAVLAPLLDDGETGHEFAYELQATSPDDDDEVWLAGPFVLTRGV